MLQLGITYQSIYLRINNLHETDKTFFEEQFGPTKNDYKKVLGLEWDIQDDETVFQFEQFMYLAKSLTPTKRNVLKVCASFCDPLQSCL